MRVLVTGGAGFIGANFVQQTVAERPDAVVTVLDALTYAGDRSSLDPVADRVNFVQGSITDAELVDGLVADADVGGALRGGVAQRQLAGRPVAVRADQRGGHVHVVGGGAPARGAVSPHLDRRGVRGPAVGGRGEVHPSTPYNPSSPYSSTKAGSDLLVRAWVRSFGVEATISNCSNNYGPYQHVEKFIPRQVTNLIDGIRPACTGRG